MPPRYAFWTILIDSKPTAFRAREKEELLPTFFQLRRTNKDVVMKWFARGRLWETPEEASAAQLKKVVPERRGHEWRPGGAHKDPRERFKKGAKPGGAKVAQVFRPAHERPAHKPSGVAQVFRPAHKHKPSDVAQVFRPAHTRPAHKPEAPRKPAEGPRPGPPPRPERTAKKPEPPERG